MKSKKKILNREFMELREGDNIKELYERRKKEERK